MPNTDEKEQAWFNSTPEELNYVLMTDCRGESLEGIDLTRAEYIHLKRCLAERRGIEHKLAEEEHANV